MRAPLITFLAALVLSACAAPQAGPATATVSILTDGQELPVQLAAGSTVQQALEKAALEPGPLDRIEPPPYAVLADGDTVRLVRVKETFEVEQQVIPFERQTVRNESLPREKQVLLQAGKNGVEEVTYRRVFEDGIELSPEPARVKSTVITEPVPEIIMVGIQTPFYPVEIPGRLVYLRDGNAWLVEGTTANRRPVVTSGDLDGRIFSLSGDGEFLLFSRASQADGEINRLWVASLDEPANAGAPGALIDLKVPNVVHFADFVPGTNNKIIFSTVEPRLAAPGWQANNDLNTLTFSLSGWTTKWVVVLQPNSGGIYGWWGMDFSWAPDGKSLAYARPDGIGTVSLQDGAQTKAADLVPLQTGADWAWVPGVAWSPDGQVLFTVDHVAPAGAANPEESPNFDLAAYRPGSIDLVHLVSQSGMFAYPLPAPDGQVAYLQAIFPNQSETTRYRLALVDRDGSNQRILFPEEGTAGLTPQRNWGAWSPAVMPESNRHALIVLNQGNLWLLDPADGQAQQITGDGLTSRVAWK